MGRSDEMAELCEGIAEVLKGRGHTTGFLEDEAGRVCLLGAGRLAQEPGHNFTPSPDYRNHSMDLHTAEALGFSEPQKVAKYNDGHIERKLVRIPIIHKLVFTNFPGDEKTVMVDDGYRTDVVEEHFPPINQQQAIDLAMDRAKYWRNQ